MLALLVGALAGGALAWWWTDDGPRPLPEPDRAAAAAALLDAMARAQAATFTAEGRFRRTVEGEVVVDDAVVVVQRPPDRLTLGFDSWDGVVDGRRVACVRQGRAGPFLSCDRPGPGDLAVDDAARLAELRGLVEGVVPTYRVTDLGTGCFRLVLDTAVRFEPAYGRRADLCFDPDTGAEVRRRVEREGSTDLTDLDRVRAAVDPADLDLPA